MNLNVRCGFDLHLVNSELWRERDATIFNCKQHYLSKSTQYNETHFQF